MKILIDEVVGLHSRLKTGLADLSAHEQELERQITVLRELKDG